MAQQICKQLKQWHERLDPTLQVLRRFAGETEDQFLQLGAQLQNFSFRSSSISSDASDLVELVAGDESSNLTSQLRQLFTNMQIYLETVRTQGDASSSILEQVLAQLDTVVQPLEGFQKMDKALRMLSISTKIESARIGELGSGFTTLALDVEKLSHAVNEKSAGIMAQRQFLETLIRENLDKVKMTGAEQHADASRILAEISNGIDSVLTLNQTCSQAGERAREVASAVASEIASVVSSMQFHDITRQQVEHVVEALENLKQHICTKPNEQNDETCKAMISETGDVCELQAAQTRHAADQLAQATLAILDSINSISAQQSQISHELQMVLLGDNSSGDGSVLSAMQRDMRDVITILNRCADADQQLADAMSEVATTTAQISGFVSDIEAVGSEINLIALNAQIKAAHTGPEGAALGVLAEAIKRLSLDAVVQTEEVSATLREINAITVEISQEGIEEQRSLEQVNIMEQEAGQIINRLGTITKTLQERLVSLTTNATGLSEEIEALTSSIHVHEEATHLANEAENVLEQIYQEARKLVPASAEFSSNLKHMEQRYTMENERLIHEMMAARHGAAISISNTKAESTGSSGFGDNVDLF